MSESLSINIRNCPICGIEASPGLPFLDRHIDSKRIGAFSYASRKEPEYMCYKLLLCPDCDVVYACESLSAGEIGLAYHQASYDSSTEALHAAISYEKAIEPYLKNITDRNGILEIGTGTGIFLQLMRKHGFTSFIGIEPSPAAIAAADADIQPCLRQGLFDSSEFEPSSQSLITCFMTLEHVTEPMDLLKECLSILKPGGIMAVVVHDWRAWNNRILGRKAPIIDIEHLQLFSKASVTEMFKRSGFIDIQCNSFKNSYRLEYWNRLLPTPPLIKRFLGHGLKLTRIGQLQFPMNVGNLMVVAQAK